MDMNFLKNIGLDSSLNQNDLQLLNQICTSMGPGGNKKMPKMTAKERNNLIAKLSSNDTLKQIPKKDLKDMNEQEKIIYRNELKQKLKNKRNELKIGRTSNLAKQHMTNNKNSTETGLINELNEIMKNISPSVSTSSESTISSELSESSNQLNIVQTENNLTQKNNAKQETIINNVINQTDDNLNLQLEDLNDYLN